MFCLLQSEKLCVFPAFAHCHLRNENLIFGTIELKGTFIPNDDEGDSKFAFSLRKNLRFRKSDIFVTAPNLIVYN